MSLSTPLFLWVVFLPAYFGSLTAYGRTISMAVSLLLNAYITMLAQFGPKIYAVFCLKQRQQQQQQQQRGRQGSRTPAGNAVAAIATASTSASGTNRTSPNTDGDPKPGSGSPDDPP